VKTAKLHDLSTDPLVESFIEVCLAQDEALLDGEIAKFNRLFDNMRHVVEETEISCWRSAAGSAPALQAS
jgi:uncharacterized protein DUF2019